ncbi:MAG: PAS domain-containing protein [Alphaproteobacteria bacterium]|nr:PAS domain-containing protein [Alphaproteobacteria bacterium]
MTESNNDGLLPRDISATPVVQLLELGAHFALAERAGRMGYWRHQLGEAQPHWSPGLFAILGLDPNEVRPSDAFLIEHIHPDDRATVMAAVSAARKEGKPFCYRSRSWNDGQPERVFETHGDIERAPNGKIIALLGVVREVTSEVAAARQLTESESAYRFMAEEASDIIARHSRDGRLEFISPAVRRILGFEPQDMFGRGPYQGAHPDDVEQIKATLSEARRTSGMVSYSYRVQHRDGHYLWFETHLRFVANPTNGAFEGAISVSRDITARKAFEGELQAARERAEAASHTKSRFLANMSHELRTPLNAIIGFSDILGREMFGPLGGERYVEYARLINESGGLLLDLINDLLDMSKIEAGKFELHYEDFLVEEAIKSALQLVERRADEQGIAIAMLVSPEQLRLRADARAFKQILLNLLSNATKFTNKGGKITVEAAQSGDSFVLSVRDTGIGISADVLPRLARPFEQATNDPSRTHGGSGLGLALVKSLTQLHGGEFAIKSQEGHGTEVTVTLPLKKPAEAERAA